MRHIFLLTTCMLMLVVVPKSLPAQEKFDLQNTNNHFYFSTTVEGAPTDIMLESGIPAMLVARSFYEENLKGTDLDFKPSVQQIKLFKNVYKIAYRAEGKIRVGNLIFDGPIFILDDFSGISLPIQYLKMKDSLKTYITLDFQEKTMMVSGQKPNTSGERFKLHIDKKSEFPIVHSVLDINSEEGNRKMKGDFIVDFGNPELLFLMKQHKEVAKALQDQHLQFIEVLDKETSERVAYVMMPESTTICGRKFEGKCIAVTEQMPAIEQLGFLGVPFFTGSVTFDFAGGMMMVP